MVLDKNGNLIAEAARVAELWAEPFEEFRNFTTEIDDEDRSVGVP